MCGLSTVELVCWPVVLALLLLPLGVASWWVAVRKVRRYRASLRRGRPFGSLQLGRARVCGMYFADAQGRSWLQERETGALLHLETGFHALPAPGTSIAVHGEVVGLEPVGPGSYRSVETCWTVQVHELVRPHQPPRFAPPVDMPPAVRPLRLLAVGGILLWLGGFFGVAWPTWLNWCHCVWPWNF